MTGCLAAKGLAVWHLKRVLCCSAWSGLAQLQRERAHRFVLAGAHAPGAVRPGTTYASAFQQANSLLAQAAAVNHLTARASFICSEARRALRWLAGGGGGCSSFAMSAALFSGGNSGMGGRWCLPLPPPATGSTPALASAAAHASGVRAPIASAIAAVKSVRPSRITPPDARWKSPTGHFGLIVIARRKSASCNDPARSRITQSRCSCFLHQGTPR